MHMECLGNSEWSLPRVTVIPHVEIKQGILSQDERHRDKLQHKLKVSR